MIQPASTTLRGAYAVHHICAVDGGKNCKEPWGALKGTMGALVSEIGIRASHARQSEGFRSLTGSPGDAQTEVVLYLNLLDIIRLGREC